MSRQGRRATDRAKTATQAYSDGHPLDDVQYLECKIILGPDRFTSVGSFREFGKIVRRTAASVRKVEFVSSVTADTKPEIREIVFFDTPDFRLYRNAFILRRRTRFADGFPVGDPEIVFKLRHPDLDTAAAVDVRPKIEGPYRIKFKSEALPLKNRVGGMRTLYSHNCVFSQSQLKVEGQTRLATLVRALPAMAAIKKAPSECVSLVNQEIVEEVLLKLGRLDFGKGVTADASVALWRTRGEHRPLVGEFSYQCRFERESDMCAKARRRNDEFFVALQHAVSDWIALGTTKTGIVYRLKGNPPQNHE